MSLALIGQRAKAAARELARLSTAQKNEALQAIATALRDAQSRILAANAADVAAGRAAGLTDALIDRLRLDEQRLAAIAHDVEHVASLPDPVGGEFAHRTLPNGLQIRKRRVPLGVVGVIYESRPNVTVDVASLCLKAGSTVILRGGKETTRSNGALVEVVQSALATCGITTDAVQSITDPDRALVLELLKLDRYVDMIIPRGGAGLHRFCLDNATVPVITGGIGVCHIFVDDTADLAASVDVIHNAKVQRPSVCNALDTLLVHRTVAPALLPNLARDLVAAGVELRADEEAYRWIEQAGLPVHKATQDDWGQEFMALILSVKVVDDLDQALDHIAHYGTGHSDSILTATKAHADRFVQDVDSAAVYVNASTRFTDGAQLGLGAEVAVSTQKLHARGPMGLEELTTYKWIGGQLEEGEVARYFVRD
ncbi:MAG: glutamate-5-semialdehyde dehydrogenase [Herpetosiphonaceae bacterium]|nr:glutamate-5-semialdehyde dehydrogenase [Herpetosiphonaceae bacterium]